MGLFSRILRLFVVAIDRLFDVLYRARVARFVDVARRAYRGCEGRRVGGCGCEREGA